MIPHDDKKKGLAAIIVSRMGKGAHEEAHEVEGDEHKEGLRAAMSDLLAAIDAKSPSDMADAFHDAFTLCEAAPHEEYEGEEEDE